MKAAANPLSVFDTADLLRELARRERARADDRKPEKWCDGCKHFELWRYPTDPPPNHNCCGKKHVMSFRMPAFCDGPHPDPSTWGFYRRCCLEYVDREAPASASDGGGEREEN